MKTGLTIAGFDPSSGAGVTADLAVMAAHGLFGTSCITALTVQSTVGVKATHPVEGGVVRETLAYLAADLPPAGIKIGMLATEAIVEEVTAFLMERPKRAPVVLDPVMRSSAGRGLLDEAGVEALMDRLMPWVGWITPNLEELGILAGMPVRTRGEMQAAAGMVCGRWPGIQVVATGGHLETPDDLVMLADGEARWLKGVRIESKATHGTGCAFSTALLCGLVHGMDGFAAAGRAKTFVAEAIHRAEPLGAGKGPMNLLWPMQGGTR